MCEVSVFKEGQSKEIGGNCSNKKRLFMCGPTVVNIQSEYKIGERHTEHEKPVDWLPAHIKDIACDEQQDVPDFPWAQPVKKQNDR
jgi:hypothetical protein